jgi:HK97 family phage major capsid protein
LSYAVLLREEQYMLNDPAEGLLALASSLDPTFAPAAGATQLDLVGSAISQLESLGYVPDAVIMNGQDINKARLLKNTFGGYVWADPDSPVGTSAMWTVPIIRSPNIAAGTFIVAALMQSAILFTREVLTLMIAFQNEDDFVRNLCTLRGEERVALSVLLPQGIVKGSFSGTAATAGAPAMATAQHANAKK